VERCRGAQSPPFTFELRVYARAEPGFLLPPIQSFGQQNLADPAALHADALFAQGSNQAVQRPGGERQAQLGRPAQRGGDDGTALFGCVGRRAPRAHLLLQPGQTLRVEPLEPEPNRGMAHIQMGGDRRRAQPLNRVLYNLPICARRTNPAPNLRERVMRASSSASPSSKLRIRNVIDRPPLSLSAATNTLCQKDLYLLAGCTT
jgi:hypothetical protein